MIALFTLVGSGSIAPTVVCAIVAFSQVGNSSIDLSLSSYPDLRLAASDDLVRSGQEPILVPLVAWTGLPALPAGVAVKINKLKRDRGRR